MSLRYGYRNQGATVYASYSAYFSAAYAASYVTYYYAKSAFGTEDLDDVYALDYVCLKECI